MNARWLASPVRAAMVLAVLAFPTTRTAEVSAEESIRVILGVTDAGTPAPQWSAMLRERLTPARYEEVMQARRPLEDADRAWLKLIRSRVPLWERERAAVARPYVGVTPPASVTVVVGNQAAPGDDAFTFDASTIGFDLGELQTAYGDALRPENAVRVDRFFRHEYSHLLQRSWLSAHPWTGGTPQADALLEIWKEGLGNYHSLSGRWVENGQPTQLAKDTLAVLEPRLVARLAALGCAPPPQASALTADLSRGPFDQKWGALPVALWLATEPDVQKALGDLVQAGPAGVWDLAARRVPASAPVLAEARKAGVSCARSAPAAR
ncbi:MAG TPA: hypothetical protein VFQ51_03460 [Vicinamibacteria bacterium]|nr:hypothetical protein [Vicinamibacteria bacterium]